MPLDPERINETRAWLVKAAEDLLPPFVPFFVPWALQRLHALAFAPAAALEFPMDRETVVRVMGEHRAELRATYGVKSLALFGSVARDQATASSDVDLLVEFENPPGFDGYMALKFRLEELLNSRVDLVMRTALKPHAKPVVEEEAIRVA